MNLSIVGIWLSKNTSGGMFQQYVFNADGTYQMKWGDDPEKEHAGLYHLENKVLSFEHMQGYVGLSNDEFILGLKRISSGEGVEGEWLLSCANYFTQTLDPFTFNLRFSLMKGVMSIVETLCVNGQPEGSVVRTGTYTVLGDTITISDNDEGIYPYFTNGTKQIKIIDDVLTLIDETTCNSCFVRVE